MPPRVKPLYSENNDFQHAETLRRNRHKRHKHREFFVEGVRPLNLALAHDWSVNAFFYSRERRLSGWAEGILATSTARVHYELPQALMDELSQKTEPSELIALIAMPDDDLTRIPVQPAMLIVVFDRPASPGNLGSIIRSCDALGAQGLVITGHAADLYDPETISATTGSLFALPVVRLAAPGDLVPWFETIRQKVSDFALVGADEKGAVELTAHDFTQPTILVMGNETWGLSQFYRELCDTLVHIPIYGSASSLNVACATSILLYEIDRQRRQSR